MMESANDFAFLRRVSKGGEEVRVTRKDDRKDSPLKTEWGTLHTGWLRLRVCLPPRTRRGAWSFRMIGHSTSFERGAQLYGKLTKSIVDPEENVGPEGI